MNLPAPTLSIVGWALLAGLSIGAYGGWRVTSWINQGHELKAVQTALRDAQTQYQKRIDDLLKQVKDGQNAVQAVIDELAALRARPEPHEPVRLCISAPGPGLLQAPAGTAPVPATAPAAGILPPDGRGNIEAGTDIGPDLRALWDKADELLATCRGAQRLLPR